jgi:hypothetical protein
VAGATLTNTDLGIMRRVLADLIGLALLIGPLYFHLVPFSESLPVLLGVPTLVGYGRGFVERRFLRPIPHWIGALEWGGLVFLADVIMCIPNPKTDPNTNYWTIFGAIFLIFIVPSLPLSVGAFMTAVRGKSIGLLRE